MAPKQSEALHIPRSSRYAGDRALGQLGPPRAARGIETAATQFPRACWVIALHHHPVEYPRVAKTLAERIGTALINGKWFVRRLRRHIGVGPDPLLRN
jgi:hypothetical protein